MKNKIQEKFRGEQRKTSSLEIRLSLQRRPKCCGKSSVFYQPCSSPVLYIVSWTWNKAINVAFKVPRLLISLFLSNRTFVCTIKWFASSCRYLIFQEKVRGEHRKTRRYEICLPLWRRPNYCNKSLVFRQPCSSLVLYIVSQACNNSVNVALKVTILLISLLVIKSYICWTIKYFASR